MSDASNHFIRCSQFISSFIRVLPLWRSSEINTCYLLLVTCYLLLVMGLNCELLILTIVRGLFQLTWMCKTWLSI